MKTPLIVTQCCDCGLGCNVAGEWYAVRDAVWELAWRGRRKSWHSIPGQSVLCIGCLEQRLGRTLCASDFTDAAVNCPDGNVSDRMRVRLAATESLPLGPPAPEKRKRGRPKGSKNKRKRGRPLECKGRDQISDR
jgi:hypothetical protein